MSGEHAFFTLSMLAPDPLLSTLAFFSRLRGEFCSTSFNLSTIDDTTSVGYLTAAANVRITVWMKISLRSRMWRKWEHRDKDEVKGTDTPDVPDSWHCCWRRFTCIAILDPGT
jgi:hypothetical protein